MNANRIIMVEYYYIDIGIGKVPFPSPDATDIGHVRRRRAQDGHTILRYVLDIYAIHALKRLHI